VVVWLARQLITGVRRRRAVCLRLRDDLYRMSVVREASVSLTDEPDQFTRGLRVRSASFPLLIDSSNRRFICHWFVICRVICQRTAWMLRATSTRSPPDVDRRLSSLDGSDVSFVILVRRWCFDGDVDVARHYCCEIWLKVIDTARNIAALGSRWN